ncbi:MAG: FeoB-associated Cys-rich membrane protein [Eubacterium sp.]|nr:FeoB-associated Cys-rich membrane protein [Eubacterium sp.]
MNLSSLIILVILAVLLFFAIRYLYKNGTCGACPDKGGCSGHCSSRAMKKHLKEDPLYKEKDMQIEEIIKKHKV